MNRLLKLTASRRTFLPFVALVACLCLVACKSRDRLTGTYVSDEKTITGNPCYTIKFLGAETAKFTDDSLLTKFVDNPLFGKKKEFVANYWISDDVVEFSWVNSSAMTSKVFFKIEASDSVLRDESGKIYRKRKQGS